MGFSLMNKQDRILLNLLFLLVFFIISLGINFLHVETTPESQKNCPACHFQNSTLLTARIYFINLPQLIQLEILSRIEVKLYEQFCFTSPRSRSPPLS